MAGYWPDHGVTVLEQILANRPGPLGDARILVVYDLEFTSWPGFLEVGFKAPGKYPEIVEIGALRVDRRHGYRELDAFACYVRPRINPDLSGYFTRLTGITQQMVARDAEWLQHQLANLSAEDSVRREEIEAGLERAQTRRHLAAQHLRSALASLLAVQRQNVDPELARELRQLWLEEMDLAVVDGDVEYVRGAFAQMERERNWVPWWRWEPDEFNRLEQLRNWLKEQEPAATEAENPDEEASPE